MVCGRVGRGCVCEYSAIFTHTHIHTYIHTWTHAYPHAHVHKHTDTPQVSLEARSAPRAPHQVAVSVSPRAGQVSGVQTKWRPAPGWRRRLVRYIDGGARSCTHNTLTHTHPHQHPHSPTPTPQVCFQSETRVIAIPLVLDMVCKFVLGLFWDFCFFFFVALAFR